MNQLMIYIYIVYFIYIFYSCFFISDITSTTSDGVYILTRSRADVTYWNFDKFNMVYPTMELSESNYCDSSAIINALQIGDMKFERHPIFVIHYPDGDYNRYTCDAIGYVYKQIEG